MALDSGVYNDFLQLVKLGIGHRAGMLSVHPDWEAIHAQASRHGLSSVLVDGVNEMSGKMEVEKCVGKERMLQWIGEVLQGYEMPRESYLQAVASLARFYNTHGYNMMVLKGYACSLDWPRPEHRPCGDIDIWLFGRQKEADAVMEQWVQGLGGENVAGRADGTPQAFKIDKSHHHHTVFEWGGFTVENHYDFVNVHSYRSSRRMEHLFKELGAFEQQGRGFTHQPVELLGERLWLPSPNLHALFLLRHLGAHFAAIDISLRQLLDWAFFAEKHTREIDWGWLQGVLEEYGMGRFFHCINAICVEDLGFSEEAFPKGDFDPALKKRILTDILSPAYQREEPESFIPRMAYKFRRWQGNAWKQKLVYKDSRFVSFWTGLGEHLFRP